MVKNKKLEDYVIYSSALDEFLRLRNFSSDELETAIDKVGALISGDKTTIRDYVQFLVDFTVYDYTKHVKGPKDDAGYDALFEAVLEAYPMFQVDSVCEILNTRNTMIPEEAGETAENPATKLNLKGLETIERALGRQVIGQQEAVTSTMEALKLRAAGFSPFTSLFFVGPTGVGKTELARALASVYLKNPKSLLKINCGEYSNPHEYSKLIGSPPGYIGFNEQGILTEKAEKSSEWIILFDEIEKASGKLHNLLLGFLDDGVIQDNRGVELDFKNSIVIFTSNVGMEALGRTTMGFDSHALSYAEVKDDIVESFKGKFPPEFINRMDQVVHFNQLTREDMAKIARLNLKSLPIKPTKKLVDWIVEGGYSSEYGARNLKRFIRQNVTLKLADVILEGPKYSKYSPSILDGELKLDGIDE